MRELTIATADAVLAERNVKIDYTIGTMIEVPRAAVTADQIARQFLAFGQVPAIATLTAKIEAVTPEQGRDLAERLFLRQKPAFSAVGHIGQLAGYDTITRHFT